MELAAGNDSTSFKFDKQAFGRINNEKGKLYLSIIKMKYFIDVENIREMTKEWNDRDLPD